MTDTHVAVSGTTDSRRATRRLLEVWRQQPPSHWEGRSHMVPIDEIDQLRSSRMPLSRHRVTVYTPSAVLTMPGFRPRDGRSATAAIASAAGLEPASSSPRADYYVRPGQPVERFDGDVGRFTDIGPGDVGQTTVRSLIWTLHSLVAFLFAWGWGFDVATGQTTGPVETLLVAAGAVVAFAAGVRLLLLRLTFDQRGVTVVNFWHRRRRLQWAEIEGATTSSLPGRLPWTAVAFTGERLVPASATASMTRGRAQRVAELVATQLDPRTTDGSIVHADDLMVGGRPASQTRPILNAGRLLDLPTTGRRSIARFGTGGSRSAT
jgi:hypothetical protein